MFAWLVSKCGVPLLPSPSAFSVVKWWAIPGYIVLLVANHWFRATRWRYLIAQIYPIRIPECVRICWISFFAIFALPLRLGEFVRPVLGKLRLGIPMSAGIGTVAIERVLDGLVTTLFVVWALFFIDRVPSDDTLVKSLPYYGYTMLIVFAAAFIMLGLFLYQRKFALKLVRKTIGLFSDRLSHLVSEKLDSLANGLGVLSRPALFVPFVVETLLYWGINALGMWFLARGCGLPIGLDHAVGLVGILALGVLLPAGPGLFGNFQLAVSVGLKLYLAESIVAGPGSVFIFLLYTIQASFVALVGLIPVYTMKLHMKDLLTRPSSPG
ncbi:MAG: flippase-like domain-containing protein [Myxococcales bacterium]|nr:MAG: flippase-like domain-containing protein [Myxococcales bacterium]